jgi:hypothetical protein
MIRTLALLTILTAVCLAGASTAGAGKAGQVCPSFTQGRQSFGLETIGSGWSCPSAKSWAVKLIGDKVAAVVMKNTPLTNGPVGYHCFANPGSHGHATDGACFKGTIAFPKSGFAWLKN